MVGYLLIG